MTQDLICAPVCYFAPLAVCSLQVELGSSGKEAWLCLRSLGAVFQCAVHCTYTFEGYVRFVSECFLAVL